MLIQQFHFLLARGWGGVFPQARTHQRACIDHAFALACVMGRRTISRTLCALGRRDQDWSADYKMFSRSHWEPERLFDPVIDEYLERYAKGPVVAAIDDTKLRKRGRKIKSCVVAARPAVASLSCELDLWIALLAGVAVVPASSGRRLSGAGHSGAISGSASS